MKITAISTRASVSSCRLVLPCISLLVSLCVSGMILVIPISIQLIVSYDINMIKTCKRNWNCIERKQHKIEKQENRNSYHWQHRQKFRSIYKQVQSLRYVESQIIRNGKSIRVIKYTLIQAKFTDKKKTLITSRYIISLRTRKDFLMTLLRSRISCWTIKNPVRK